MSARVMVAVGALACVLAIAPTVDAQDPTSRPSDSLMSQGHDLYAAGRYKDAAASFERAMQLGVERPHEAAWEVARSYAQLGNRKQAVRWQEIAERLRHPASLSSSAIVLPFPARALD